MQSISVDTGVAVALMLAVNPSRGAAVLGVGKMQIADLVKLFEKNLADTQAEFDALSDSERAQFVILCHGLPINIDGRPGKLGGMVTTLAKATRFSTRERANDHALLIVNGKGERGKVYSVTGAYIHAMNEAHEGIINCKRAIAE
jgi:hypothetical protein